MPCALGLVLTAVGLSLHASNEGVVGAGVMLYDPSKSSELVATAGDVGVFCREPGSWRFSLADLGFKEGVRELTLVLENAEETMPPAFRLEVRMPKVDMPYAWSPAFGCPGRIGLPSWANWYSASRLLPVTARFNGDNRNRQVFACNDVYREISYAESFSEVDYSVTDAFRFFEGVSVPVRRYEVRFRLDRRDVFWSEAVSDAVAWVSKTGGVKAPAVPPPAAYRPLYSTWYDFHQDVTAEAVEREYARAAKLGMEVAILDDGWHMDKTAGTYARCGDWAPAPTRFPDMAAHVKRVHALGLKYMVWYSVPFLGFDAAAVGRFRDKTLYRDDRIRAYALDPRFPEVRDYLVGVYERALREWDVDGFKLDFIDQIETRDKPDPAVAQNFAGRDYRSVPEAVQRLLQDIHARLEAIKPGLLFEYRQAYVGPVVRQYGNMMRVADCPGSLAANRVGTVDLRLVCPGSAVHADMIKWADGETPEGAARYVLSSIFGVVQYSAKLGDLPEAHLRMLKHWIAFTKRHEATLLRGNLRPHRPECDFPVVEAWDAEERIVLVSSAGFSADVRKGVPAYVLNNTGTGRLVLRFDAAATVEFVDTFGEPVGRRAYSAGLHDVPVPVSGYARISF